MGISPIIWATLIGGGAFLWWTNKKKNAIAPPARPQAPTGSATPIPQTQPINLTPSATPVTVVPSGVVPGSIWV